MFSFIENWVFLTDKNKIVSYFWDCWK